MNKAAAKDQAMKVLEYLKEHGTITVLEAFEMGITRLSARIWELRHILDEKIVSKKRTVETRYGKQTVAVYELVREAES